ncbi:cytochrome P450 [Inquilinus limosus]|uniref:cytochrome P450 n=1 Tax=Inquilinus limosus TaxID=171674 RepID=UPI003F1487B4
MNPVSSRDLPESFFRTYDHHTPDCIRELHNMARQAHERCPVFRSDSHGGFYVVTRYDDIMEVACNPAIFSSRRGFEIPEARAPMLIPLHCDPPEVTEYRRLLHPYLTASAVEGLREDLRTIVMQRIEDRLGQGRLDVIPDLALPASASMALKIIGFDPELWDEYAMAYHNHIFRLVPPDLSFHQIYRLSLRIIEDIRRFREAPAAGTLLSDLLTKKFRGRPLTDGELTAIVSALIVGGTETVQATIGMMLVYLDENPEQRQRLIENPGLIPNAVEELLRVLATQPGMARTVTKDYVLGGVPLSKGDKVLLLWAAANFDADKFPSPFEVDFCRPSNSHLTFGAGSHKCIGLHLARMELAVCLEVILQRIPNYRVRRDQLRAAPGCSLIFGFESVPIEFEAERSPERHVVCPNRTGGRSQAAPTC